MSFVGAEQGAIQLPPPVIVRPFFLIADAGLTGVAGRSHNPDFTFEPIGQEQGTL
jgi:hypothetical protein